MHEAEDPAVRRQRPQLRREGGGGAQGESGRKKKQTPGHQGVSSANRRSCISLRFNQRVKRRASLRYAHVLCSRRSRH